MLLSLHVLLACIIVFMVLIMPSTGLFKKQDILDGMGDETQSVDGYEIALWVFGVFFMLTAFLIFFIDYNRSGKRYDLFSQDESPKVEETQEEDKDLKKGKD